MQSYAQEPEGVPTTRYNNNNSPMVSSAASSLSPTSSGMKRSSLELPPTGELPKRSRLSEGYFRRPSDPYFGQHQHQHHHHRQAFDTSFSGSYGASALGSLSGVALQRYLSETSATLPYQGMAHAYPSSMAEARFQLVSQAGLLGALSAYPPPRLGLSYNQMPMRPLDTLSSFSSYPESARASLALPLHPRPPLDAESDRSAGAQATEKKRPIKRAPAAATTYGGGADHHHAHYTERNHVALSIDEDPNWLSELQCFVRAHLLEVCWASREDVAVRNSSKKVSLDQVGIRCRYCAHNPPGSRAQRSSAFPSSIPQLYQSFTMMLRDHFDNCICIPVDVKEKYLAMKSATCQGATEAKRYWSYSAQRLGMADSDEGIIMNDSTREAAESMVPFGSVPEEDAVPPGGPILLVRSADHSSVSGFLFTLVSHFQRIELLPSERKGNRKSLSVGLPGFGCRYCTKAGRFGMSRVFPARRRTLPVRIADLYDHMCRCNLCPPEAKIVLQQLRAEEKQSPNQEKKFLDLVWERLGHTQANP